LSSNHDPAENANKHRELAASIDSIGFAVVTVTDSRKRSEDVSGDLIKSLLLEAGHDLLHYALLPNDRRLIAAKVRELVAMPRLRLAVFTGGTGLGPRDVTVDVVRSYFDKTIDGFGELFRYLSYGEIGPAAMMSRAAAGIVGDKVLVSLPGSANAVRLAMTQLLVPELRHLVNEPTRIGGRQASRPGLDSKSTTP